MRNKGYEALFREIRDSLSARIDIRTVRGIGLRDKFKDPLSFKGIPRPSNQMYHLLFSYDERFKYGK